LLPILSSLSVSWCPVDRLRHWCSSRYLRIPPLHREFHLPLHYSRKTVLKAIHGLSPWFSLPTCSPACAPFTPSNSGQRLHPTFYRGCWHVVSRCFLVRYRHSSSLTTGVYNPKTFFLHAASLHQGFPHCAISPTAASRRSLGRVSVPMWPFNLLVRLPIVALVGRYLTNWLIGRESILKRINPFPSEPCGSVGLCGISSRFQLLSPTPGQVTHALLTRSPLSYLLTPSPTLLG